MNHVRTAIDSIQLDVDSQIIYGLLRFPDESDAQLRGRMTRVAVQGNFVMLLVKLGLRVGG